jgi:cell wall assembly regulator SMI1
MGQLITMQSINPFGATNLEEIQAFELQFGIKLPLAMKSFLLYSNGGRPVNNIQPILQTDIHWILGLNESPNWASLQGQINLFSDKLPPNTIPIAGDSSGNLFLIQLEGEHSGRIGFWPLDEGTHIVTPIANDFEEFLNSLISDANL